MLDTFSQRAVNFASSIPFIQINNNETSNTQNFEGAPSWRVILRTYEHLIMPVPAHTKVLTTYLHTVTVLQTFSNLFNFAIYVVNFLLAPKNWLNRVSTSTFTSVLPASVICFTFKYSFDWGKAKLLTLILTSVFQHFPCVVPNLSCALVHQECTHNGNSFQFSRYWVAN